MFNIRGKYGEATIYSYGYDEKSISQIYELLNQTWTEGLSIKIMPDYHAGAGCVIGTTMTITDKIVPNLVGVDIGCGMLTVELGDIEIDLISIDDFIRNNIPSGQSVNEYQTGYAEIEKLTCLNKINEDRALKSLGTLGGGNHFIEIDIDDNGLKYLIIHTGSRYLGKQVEEYHQEEAFEQCNYNKHDIDVVINKLKSEKRFSEIELAIKEFKSRTPNIPKRLSFLTGDKFNDYINDMKIVQKYASENRMLIASKILKHLGLESQKLNKFETIHNYIDTETMILRKGAISSKDGEAVLIPINMRDGCIIGVGKGNDNFNQSAPHGAGRLMSRGQAKELVTIEEYKESMHGIYSTSVNNSTLDESPMAYKPIDEILNNIVDTVDVVKIIKPIYNFKASE